VGANGMHRAFRGGQLWWESVLPLIPVEDRSLAHWEAGGKGNLGFPPLAHDVHFLSG
jgi:hypothetical protein